MNRRFSLAVAWRAVTLVLLAPGAGVAAAAQTGAAGPSTSAGGGTLASVVTPEAATLQAQARVAASRLQANMRAPHPGRPEALTHPEADHMSGRRPGTAALAAAVRPATVSTSTQKGLDVSSYQGNVNWAAAKANGATFAYMKATEGTYYTDGAYFTEQYNGSYQAGLVRGSYHFAIPNGSTGAAQADFFVAHGGGWSGDGHTLPGTLDIEYNPYGAECYGLSPSQMVAWVKSFDSEYKRLTNRYPTIYTTTGWWTACTGNASVFGLEGLALAHYASSVGTLPASWTTWNIWQYADSGVFPGDQDLFNGGHQQLVDFAYGPAVSPPVVIASTVPLNCGSAGGDKRTPAEASIQPGVVVVSHIGNELRYATDTVTSAGQLQAIPTSLTSAATPIVAVWQNSTDCTGAASSRNAWATGPTGAVYGESTRSGPPAKNFGDASRIALAKPVVGMSPTRDANGYWLVASDGGIFSYGDARFHGSTGGVNLARPVVGMSSTPDGGGYWLVASDGGIFAFGDARFFGSTGGVKLVKPIEGMVATADGHGYWMVASDGGVFCFGDAGFHGSMGGKALSAPIAGLVPNGTGYTLIGGDGRTYPFP